MRHGALTQSALPGKNVPTDLLEAASIDGAGRFRRIWHINIPGIMPTIIILLIMACGTLMSVGFEKT